MHKRISIWNLLDPLIDCSAAIITLTFRSNKFVVFTCKTGISIMRHAIDFDSIVSEGSSWQCQHKCCQYLKRIMYSNVTGIFKHTHYHVLCIMAALMSRETVKSRTNKFLVWKWILGWFCSSFWFVTFAIWLIMLCIYINMNWL